MTDIKLMDEKRFSEYETTIRSFSKEFHCISRCGALFQSTVDDVSKKPSMSGDIFTLPKVYIDCKARVMMSLLCLCCFDNVFEYFIEKGCCDFL
jgi:hypothetical protein